MHAVARLRQRGVVQAFQFLRNPFRRMRDFLAVPRLFDRRIGQHRRHVARALNILHNRLQNAARAIRKRHAGGDRFKAVLHGKNPLRRAHLQRADNGGDFLCRMAGALREFLDFSGHDGKAAPVFSGLRRNNRGVQGKQIRLLGDAVNDFDDFADPLGFFAKPLNCRRRVFDGFLDCQGAFDHFFHGVAAALRFGGNGFRNAGERMGMRLNLLHERMNVLNRPRRRIGRSGEQFDAIVHLFDGRNHVFNVRERAF